jgi:hypothetical protein
LNLIDFLKEPEKFEDAYNHPNFEGRMKRNCVFPWKSQGNNLQKTSTGCGLQGNSVNPCLWKKYTEHGIVFVGIYVNDCFVIGNENGINDIINGLKTYKFGLKIEDDLKDYLSFRILNDSERKTMTVMQPHFLNNLKENFGKEVNNLNDYGTPGTPRFKIMRLLALISASYHSGDLT